MTLCHGVIRSRRFDLTYYLLLQQSISPGRLEWTYWSLKMRQSVSSKRRGPITAWCSVVFQTIGNVMETADFFNTSVDFLQSYWALNRRRENQQSHEVPHPSIYACRCPTHASNGWSSESDYPVNVKWKTNYIFIGMGVCPCECCVLSGSGLRRADHSSWGALPRVVCLSVTVKPQWWGRPGPQGAVVPWEKEYIFILFCRP